MKNNNDHDQIMRLLIIGNSSVGKTCLLRRFSEGTYQDSFIPTIGIDFAIKKMTIDNKIVKIQIFDTAGQERFKSIVQSYFRSTDGIIIVFDITDLQSFQDIEDYWLKDVKQNSQENTQIIIVGNKLDMEKDRKITFETGKQFATKYNLTYIETSAKTQQNVNETFEAIARDVYFKKKLQEPKPSQDVLQLSTVNNKQQQKKQNKGCFC